MPYDAEMARRHGEWATAQWRRLPPDIKTGLLPCLRAADEGFPAVQREWLRFAGATPMKVWEYAALCDVLRYLARNVTPEARAELIAEMQEVAA